MKKYILYFLWIRFNIYEERLKHTAVFLSFSVSVDAIFRVPAFLPHIS